MDLPADILKAAHDDGGAVLPQEEHIVLPKGPKYKLFKRLVIKRIITKIMVNTETPNNPNPGALAAHFYLDGKGYFYHGELTYELPEGYEYVGDVINVGDISSGSRKDFEGNVDGRIYMNPSISDTAYFSWADSEWNEEVDGPKPFLKLEIKTTE